MSKKKDAGKGAAKGGDRAVRLAAHPRAVHQVRRAKSWGALAAFALMAFSSLRAGVPLFDAGLRALAAGIVGYVVAWAATVVVWRHIVVAELRATEKAVVAARARAIQESAKQAAEG